MLTQNLELPNIESTLELRQVYADMIRGAHLTDNGSSVWEKIDEVWEQVPEIEVTQGEVTGIINREAVSYFLGSLAGYSIFVDLKTPAGDKNIQLALRGDEPTFTFTPSETTPGIIVEPIRPDYRQSDIQESFDWGSIISDVKRKHDLDPIKPLYLVAFRSQLIQGADTQILLEHDARAHRAALESPALLHYFADHPDENGQALSFCLWSDRNEAKSISRDTRHKEATKMIKMYESYSLEKYDVSHTSEVVLTRIEES